MQIDPTKLIEARLARAMSQEEVAIACDLSTRTIQRIEAGHTASLESTKALLTTFGADIIHDPEVPAPQKLQSSWQSMAVQISSKFRSSVGFCFDGLRIALAAVLILIAAAKPFVPDQTGLFVGGDFASLGLLSGPPAGSQEILGFWITPIMIVAGGAVLMSMRRLRLLIDNRASQAF